VAPAQGNAKLPERPRDESGLREARPARLHCLVGQVPEQRQGRGPKAPEGLNRDRHEGQGGGHLPIRTPLAALYIIPNMSANLNKQLSMQTDLMRNMYVPRFQTFLSTT
jgi:hypothetical protein